MPGDKVGTNVLVERAVAAEQAPTVQDATNNGLALGIGFSHKFFIENSLGLDYSKPIPHTREYLTILNGLMAGEYVKHSGALYTGKAQVSVVGATKPPVPVLLSDDVDAGRDTVNEAFRSYGQIPSYRATLERGGAAMPAAVAVIGNAIVAVVPPSAPSAQATKELLSTLATLATAGP